MTPGAADVLPIGRRPVGRIDGLQPLPVRLPVPGVLVVEPLHEVVADDQVGPTAAGCSRSTSGRMLASSSPVRVRQRPVPASDWSRCSVTAASRPGTASTVNSSVSVVWAVHQHVRAELGDESQRVEQSFG